MANEKLNGKVVVITGASSGFGKGAALKFAQAGSSVVLAARRDNLLDELARECEAAGGQALAVPADVSQRGDVEKLAQAALSRFGRIDIWVNNAGAGAIGRFEEVPLDDHIQVIETDLLGTLYGSYFAMKQFRQQNCGILINVASVIGKVPSPYFSSYAAAKHGVVGLSAAIRQELTQNKIDTIRVSTVMPTSMDTPFFEHAATYTGKKAEPIPPLYNAEEVVDVIFRMATKPEDEISVGTAGKIAAFMHQIAPGLTEAMMGRQTHRAEIENAPSSPDSDGSVHEPVAAGTGVRDKSLKK